MDQKLEKAVTPEMLAHRVLSRNRDKAPKSTPAKAKAHQQRLPKWYSALITIGWKRPIMRKVAKPMIMPEKFMFTDVKNVWV